jgi:hypothetical protein
LTSSTCTNFLNETGVATSVKGTNPQRIFSISKIKKDLF